jgi:hypothetical protein
MKEKCRESKDYTFFVWLFLYRIMPTHFMAKIVSGKLRCKRHAALVDNIIYSIENEAAYYPNRVFGEDGNAYEELREAARHLKEIYESRGFKSEVYYEEPFQYGSDDTKFSAYVLSYEDHRGLRESVVREIGDI